MEKWGSDIQRKACFEEQPQSAHDAEPENLRLGQAQDGNCNHRRHRILHQEPPREAVEHRHGSRHINGYQPHAWTSVFASKAKERYKQDQHATYIDAISELRVPTQKQIFGGWQNRDKRWLTAPRG